MLSAETAKKVLEVVDAGLVSGVGSPEPGKMCVEAAVCYAMGEPHGDQPTCVSAVLRTLKITINDSNWSSDQARAKGLRRIAIAQLGTSENFDEEDFMKRVSEMTIRKVVPIALRAAAGLQNAENKLSLENAALECENIGAWSAAKSAAKSAAESAAKSAAESAAKSAAWSAESAAWSAAESAAKSAAKSAAESAAWSAAKSAKSAAESAAYDDVLSFFAEEVVQILIAMKTPGSQWLGLTE